MSTVFVHKQARRLVKHTNPDCFMVRADPDAYLEIPARIVDPAIRTCERCDRVPTYDRIKKARAER